MRRTEKELYAFYCLWKRRCGEEPDGFHRWLESYYEVAEPDYYEDPANYDEDS